MVSPNDSSHAAHAAPHAAAAAAPDTPDADVRRPAVSARKRRANRRNAQQSTGPRTPEGKARASRNATTHGIFCRDLVLPGESEDLFHLTRDGFLDALKPQDAAQLALVDTAVGARWRLNRCQFAEAVLLERRIAAVSAKVTQGFESLQQQMKFDDFSAAAIDAQCNQSERFRAHFARWRELRDAQGQALRPGHALALLMHSNRDGDHPLERLSRYEQRLEGSFHRCLRDLHVLKQRAKDYADEPPSPFRSRRVVVEEREPEQDAEMQNEPTAADVAASTGAGGGSDARRERSTAPDPQEMAALRKFSDLLDRCRPSEEPQPDARELPPDWRT